MAAAMRSLIAVAAVLLGILASVLGVNTAYRADEEVTADAEAFRAPAAPAAPAEPAARGNGYSRVPESRDRAARAARAAKPGKPTKPATATTSTPQAPTAAVNESDTASVDQQQSTAEVPPPPAASSGEESSGATAASGPGVQLAAGDWLSGSAGLGVGTGQFGTWRGSPVEIAATWADNNEAMVGLWQLRPGGEYASWQNSIDISVGAFGPGETWGQAAQGAYDARWRKSLTELRNLWGSRPGTVYIRFAHEMNGNWFPWKVTAGDTPAFIQAWKRFDALQNEIFPAAKLAFSVNRESLNSGIDWRKTFPGKEHVDVMSVDYYNQYPYVKTQAEWDASLQATDGYGAPKGLQRHLDFAREVGLPLGISEWSGNADNGDSPVYIEQMHAFFSKNAGSGAGQVLYECQFNVVRDGGRWHLSGDTRMPSSAEAYRRLF